MKTKVVKIGNSYFVQIPESIIHYFGLEKDVVLNVSEWQIILKSSSGTRESWDAAFKKMAKNKDDILFDTDATFKQSKWDQTELKW